MSLTETEEAELLALLEAEAKAEARRKLFTYYPDEGPLRRELYPRHMEHFAKGAEHRERLFMAGNRCGKTIAGAYETALHLTGRYPHWWVGRRFNAPVQWWAAGKTNETSRDIVQRELFGDVTHEGGKKGFTGTGMVPGDDIGTISWKQGVTDLADTILVRHQTGGWSSLGLKSYQQGRGAFEGTAKHGVWVDEEPDMDVFTEALMRTMTTDGIVILTFTPLMGYSEVVQAFLEGAPPATSGAQAA